MPFERRRLHSQHLVSTLAIRVHLTPRGKFEEKLPVGILPCQFWLKWSTLRIVVKTLTWQFQNITQLGDTSLESTTKMNNNLNYNRAVSKKQQNERNEGVILGVNKGNPLLPARQNNYTSQTKLSSFLILWSVFRFSPIVPKHSLISIFNSFLSSFVMIDRRAANDRIAAPVPGAALKLKRNCISKLVRINRIIYSVPSSGESRPSDKGVPGYPGTDRHWDKWGWGRSDKEFFRLFGPEFDQR